MAAILKCDVKSTRIYLNWKTFLPNFIPIRFVTM